MVLVIFLSKLCFWPCSVQPPTQNASKIPHMQLWNVGAWHGAKRYDCMMQWQKKYIEKFTISRPKIPMHQKKEQTTTTTQTGSEYFKVSQSSNIDGRRFVVGRVPRILVVLLPQSHWCSSFFDMYLLHSSSFYTILYKELNNPCC